MRKVLIGGLLGGLAALIVGAVAALGFSTATEAKQAPASVPVELACGTVSFPCPTTGSPPRG